MTGYRSLVDDTPGKLHCPPPGSGHSAESVASIRIVRAIQRLRISRDGDANSCLRSRSAVMVARLQHYDATQKASFL